MNTQTIRMKTAILSTLLVAGSTGFATNAMAQIANTHCYNFDNPTVGMRYELGETVMTSHATINLQKFFIDDVASQSATQYAEVVGLNLIDPPSLNLASVVTQVVPNTGVQSVTYDYAENTGLHNTQRKNFGVNGERMTDLIGSLAQLDGQILGLNSLGGQVLVSVTAVADSTTLPTWVRGSVTLTALGSAIRFFAIGGSSQTLIDNVCMSL